MNAFIKYTILFSICALSLSLGSCIRFIKKVEPSENIITREYDLKGFERINAAKGIILHYRQGDEYLVKAQGPGNMMEELRCKVDKGKILTLEVLHLERFTVSDDSEKIHVWITAPNVDAFSVMADAVIHSEPIFGKNNLSIKTFNGSAFLCDSIQAESLTINTYNGSSVTITDCQAHFLRASAFNLGSITMGGQIENTMSLEACNGATIKFNGTAETVKAQAHNTADIQLEGEFANKQISQHNAAQVTIGVKIGTMDINIVHDVDKTSI